MQRKYFVSMKQSVKDWRFWAKLLIGTAQITSVVVFIAFSSIQRRSIYPLLENLSYFTTQSNLFCGVFFIYSALFHYNEGKGKFDNDEVAKIALTYLMVTILNFNFNEWVQDFPYSFDNWRLIMSFICEHSLVPILAIIYYLFFYDHENAKNIKEFSKKWVWLMVIGLVAYLTVFSIIGEIARVNNWKHLFWTVNGNETTFVYPFLDWFYGVGLLKGIPPWAECIIILTGIVILAVGTDYWYTLIVLQVKKKKVSNNNQNKQSLQKTVQKVEY